MKSKKKTSTTELELLNFCDYAVVSRENKLSILGVFDQIYIQNVPSNYPKMFVVGIIKGTSNYVYSVKLKLKSPSGNDLLPSQDLKNNFGHNGSSNIIAEFSNLPLPEFGVYKLELHMDNEVLGTREFRVFPPNNLPQDGGKDNLPN